MLRNLNESSGGQRILGVPAVGILASQIISETATGDSGPGLLYDEALVQTGRQLRCIVTSYTGTLSTLFVFENGSILLEGETDGTYTLGYNWEAWDGSGVITGSDTAAITVGPVSAVALAGVGISTGRGTGGLAFGGITGVGTSVGSGTGGEATAEDFSDIIAPGGLGLSLGSGSGGEYPEEYRALWEKSRPLSTAGRWQAEEKFYG